MRPLVFLWIAIANLVAAVLFVVLLFLMPLGAELDARMRFTQLDREGVINVAALEKFHPQYGFTESEYRRTVPDYIAAEALENQRGSATLGLIFVAANAVAWGMVWFYGRRNRATLTP